MITYGLEFEINEDTKAYLDKIAQFECILLGFPENAKSLSILSLNHMATNIPE